MWPIPLILNDPEGWRFSSLRKTGTPSIKSVRRSLRISGVTMWRLGEEAIMISFRGVLDAGVFSQRRRCNGDVIFFSEKKMTSSLHRLLWEKILHLEPPSPYFPFRWVMLAPPWNGYYGKFVKSLAEKCRVLRAREPRRRALVASVIKANYIRTQKGLMTYFLEAVVPYKWKFVLSNRCINKKQIQCVCNLESSKEGLTKLFTLHTTCERANRLLSIIGHYIHY